MSAAALPRPAGNRAVRGETVAVLGLSAAAWAGLAVWGASPYRDALGHHGLAEAARPLPWLLLVFVAGWVLMLVSMMLPSTRPVLAMFGATIRARPDRARLAATLVGAYVAVWVGVGLVAFAGDLALHELAHRVRAVEDHRWAISAGALALAGAYQLSSLKERCLTRCRSPRLMVVAHWHGRRPLADAAALGADAGWSCVGCCWALMLLMFAIGTGNLGWMLGLAAVMTLEKAAPWGRRLTVPVAAGLLVAAAAVVAANA